MAGLLVLERVRPFQRVFHWLPIPLWCYGIPMALQTAGWLPTNRAAYLWATDLLFPIALGLLLLGVDLRALARIGTQAMLAMAIGVASVVLSGPLLLLLFRGWLPAEAWKGVGMLAATWTGGSLNMLALRTILNVPDAIFAPLVVVDALVAYSWMACLVSCQNLVGPLNRWLRAQQPTAPANPTPVDQAEPASRWWAAGLAVLVSAGLAMGCRWLAHPLPTGGLVSSTTGWAVLFVTTLALALSWSRRIRALGQQGSHIGYICLYIVLATLGAQASFKAFLGTPIWAVLGFAWVACHAAILLLAGRWLRLPFGVLATASQANIGGVVSAPLVGAVYDQTLAPVGLLLAVAANAVGTYLGMGAALIAKLLSGSP